MKAAAPVYLEVFGGTWWCIWLNQHMWVNGSCWEREKLTRKFVLDRDPARIVKETYLYWNSSFTFWQKLSWIFFCYVFHPFVLKNNFSIRIRQGLPRRHTCYWIPSLCFFIYKVNRCLARYSPRATTTSRPTIRAPNKPAWPGHNWPKMPILGQIWSFLGKKSFF